MMQFGSMETQLYINTAHEYGFSNDVSAKIRYTGYLDQRPRLKYAAAKSTDVLTDLNLPPGELVLCMVGGGARRSTPG